MKSNKSYFQNKKGGVKIKRVGLTPVHIVHSDNNFGSFDIFIVFPTDLKNKFTQIYEEKYEYSIDSDIATIISRKQQVSQSISNLYLFYWFFYDWGGGNFKETNSVTCMIHFYHKLWHRKWSVNKGYLDSPKLFSKLPFSWFYNICDCPWRTWCKVAHCKLLLQIKIQS